MKYLKRLGMLGLVVLTASGCEDITNPVDVEGQQVGPYVHFVADTATLATRLPGAANPALAILRLPVPVEEDVVVTYTFGGDAVFGQDFVPVDRTGAPRTDVTAAGGTAVLNYDFDDVRLPQDTLRLRVPATAVSGRVLHVTLTSATTAQTNRALETGYVERFRRFVLRVR
jgi:hypothetical protein